MPPRTTVVCVLTGTGLKDPEIALKQAHTPPRVQPSIEEVERKLGW